MARLLPQRGALCIALPGMSAPLPTIDRSVVLVGLMGAGKSTIGRRLARRLGLPFADSDEEIERAADRSIPDIFDRFGEASFRDGERRVIARLVAGPPAVIATGGGAFVDPETRRLILDRCVAVWLDADLDLLAERVSRRDTRPLLRGKEPIAVLRELAERRSPLYAEAQIRVRSGPAPQESAVDDIVAALRAWSAAD
jgi:shikimate kinase